MRVWHDGQIDLDPCAPLDATLRAAPAKWCVYLMCDSGDRPVQMLCVRNLRASLKRRLTGSDEASRRVDYRALVRRVYWKRVDGALESDLAFLDVARIVYPETYRKLIPPRTVWWVHVDPDAPHPRWRAVEDPLPGCGTSFGPLLEKSHAQRLVEKLEDLFDLCRYHHVLVQAPNGPPCAYKEMGKCPAPCDGSVSMQQYRQLVRWSVATLTDPTTEIGQQAQRMKEAAAEMRFEVAGRIKAFVDGLKALREGENRHVRPARSFDFVALQPGPAKGQAKLLDVTLGGVCERLGYLAEPAELPPPPSETPVTAPDAERLGLVVAHLFGAKTAGAFIPRTKVDRSTLVAAYKATLKQPKPRTGNGPNGGDNGDDEDEGVVREAVAG